MPEEHRVPLSQHQAQWWAQYCSEIQRGEVLGADMSLYPSRIKERSWMRNWGGKSSLMMK